MGKYVIEVRDNNGDWEATDNHEYTHKADALRVGSKLAASMAIKDGHAGCMVARNIRVRDLDAVYPEFMLRMDWKLLREQKLALMRLQDYTPPKNCDSEEHNTNMEAIEGILNALDAIQDYAVDVMGLPSKQVFVPHTKEG